MDWQDSCFSWSERIAASRQEDAFNDVEFIVKGVKYKANSWILAMASPVMFAHFYGPLADKDRKPVYINDEMGSARGFEALLSFIHEEDYSITNLLDRKQKITEGEELEKLMELLVFGDKYQIKSLITFCRNVLIQKIQFSRENVSEMKDVMCKYTVLTTEYQMFNTQMKAYQCAILDVVIFERWSYAPRRQTANPKNYQIKFKVNHNVLFHFDATKQGINYDQDHEVSRYIGIYWKPKNGPEEIVEDFNEEAIITNFHAEANTEITLKFKMTDGAEIFSFDDEDSYSGNPYIPRTIDPIEDFEVDILEMNNKPFREAITNNEGIPISKLCFRLLEWGA